jgi:hypothetical protein
VAHVYITYGLVDDVEGSGVEGEDVRIHLASRR